MRISNTILGKVKQTILSVMAVLIVSISAGSASASSLNISTPSVQLAIADSAIKADIIKVGHRKHRWKKGLHIYFGTPYYYGRYRKYYPSFRYCRKWSRKCAYRHGWHTWRWERCMRYRGC